ncbi:MAG: nucleoside phosphorylase [Ruminiclostridium sp.]|nr:nucleoside phosphorylase [Ruminiclostridium sp.]
MALIHDDFRFHLNIRFGDVGKYVILTGDPGRVPAIAALLDEPTHIAQNREYNIYNGSLDGERVTVCSTGIGGPSTAIAVEELVMSGSDTFVRIGTSGGMDMKVIGGDLVVASGAVRSEGTSREYIPIEYPAVPDYDVMCALKTAGDALSTNEDGNRCHVGVVHCKDSFYGEIDPNGVPVSSTLAPAWDAYVSCGCLTSEMESAALFAVAAARHVRAGSVFTALWNVERTKAGLPDKVVESNERAIRCAVDAIRLLIEKDRNS